MLPRLYAALAVYAILAALSIYTLDGKIRLATLVFIGGLAFKSYLHYLTKR
jgi:hypothetical protein